MTNMPYDVTLQRKIQSYIDAQLQDEKDGKTRLEREKLVISGKVHSLPIISIPNDHLLFNTANGRIKAEVLDFEFEMQEEIDLYNKEHQKIIKSILLKMNTSENTKISEDLENKGQLKPGIVTCDGILINGNRRKALLEELFDKTKDQKYSHLDVQVLPIQVTKKDIWCIEAGIQLSSPQQLDYSPINNLLALKDGLASGLSSDEISASVYGYSKEKVQKDIERLILIDLFLDSFLKKPHKYQLVNKLNEHFIDLQNMIGTLKNPKNLKSNWEWTDSDISDFQLVAFHFIRSHFSHLEIRRLRDLFVNEQSWLLLYKTITESPPKSQPGQSMGSNSSLPDNLDIDHDNEANSVVDDNKDFQDRLEEEEWQRQHNDFLKMKLEEAKEQKQIADEQNEPLKLARRALRIISGINVDSSGLQEESVDFIFAEIISKINVLRKHTIKQSHNGISGKSNSRKKLKNANNNKN